MQRWKQYSGLAALFAAFLAAGYWGFTATGGALPWAKRSAQALQRGEAPVPSGEKGREQTE